LHLLRARGGERVRGRGGGARTLHVHPVARLRDRADGPGPRGRLPGRGDRRHPVVPGHIQCRDGGRARPREGTAAAAHELWRVLRALLPFRRRPHPQRPDAPIRQLIRRPWPDNRFFLLPHSRSKLALRRAARVAELSSSQGGHSRSPRWSFALRPPTACVAASPPETPLARRRATRVAEIFSSQGGHSRSPRWSFALRPPTACVAASPPETPLARRRATRVAEIFSSQGGHSRSPRWSFALRPPTACVAASPPETPLARRRATRVAEIFSSQGGHSRIAAWAFASPPETPLARRRATRAAELYVSPSEPFLHDPAPFGAGGRKGRLMEGTFHDQGPHRQQYAPGDQGRAPGRRRRFRDLHRAGSPPRDRRQPL